MATTLERGLRRAKDTYTEAQSSGEDPTSKSKSQALSQWLGKRRSLLIGAALLMALAFAQSFGKVVYDTKLALTVNPGQFLHTALHLWDPANTFGEVQNQVYGYLFPLGPYYLAMHLAHAPAWVAERIWLGLILITAFTGAIKLAEEFEIASPGARLAAGAFYALAPMVIELSSVTAGILPYALLPWGLLALSRGAKGGSILRSAALFGITVLLMGGTNATSVLAVLFMPGIFMLSRPRGKRKWKLLGAAIVAVWLVCFWWAASLLLQGKYGFDFLPFTETARTTTQFESIPEILRGGGMWLALLNVHGIWLRSGWAIENVAVTIVMGSLLAGLGLAGLAMRDMPEKRFLLATLAIGVLVIGVGYWGHLGSPLEHLVHEGLDGPLAPFRNVIKFEPIVELPIALGLAHLLGKVPWSRLEERLHWAGPSWSRARQSPLSPPRLAAIGVFGLCLSLAALPMFEGKAYQKGGWKKIPSYWYEAADWLNAHGGHTNTLLIPGSDYGDFPWGDTQDEPFLPLLKVPWAVRNIIPLGSQGNTEILDEVDRILARGHPVPGLAAFLRRAGIKYLVVDNTLNRSQTQSPSPLTIRSVLAGEHDLVPVRSFGPVMGSSGASPGPTSSSTAKGPTSLAARPLRPLEIYQVLGTSSPVMVFPQADTITLTGGPQGMLALRGAHLLGDRAVFLAGDPHGFTGTQATWVVTDSQKRIDENFGELYQSHSYVLQAHQMSPFLNTPPKRYEVVPGVAYQTVAVLSGARSVTSSSYGAPITQIPGYQPLGAFEAHAGTAVWAAAKDTPGQWIKISFDHPRYVASISLTPLDDGPWRPVVDKVEVTTTKGSVVRRLLPRQEPQRVHVIPGRTSFVKVTILSATRPLQKGSPAGPGLAHISIPGVKVVEWLKVPNDAPSSLKRPGARPPIYFFNDPQPDRFSSLSPPDPEPHMHRIFYVPNPAPYAISGQVTPRAGPALLEYVAGHHRLTVKASSVYNDLPIYRPQNLIDGDVFTSWEASSADVHPEITMSWKKPATLTSVLVQPDHAASRPAEMLIRADGQSRLLQVPKSGGLLHFKALVTNKVDITFPKIYRLRTFDTLTKSYTSIPLGISQLEFPAVSYMQIMAANFSSPLYVPCGEGPRLEVAGHVVQTEITGTVGDLYNLQPMDFYACSPPIELPRGEQRLAALDAGSPFKITSVTLKDPYEKLPSSPSRSASYLTYRAESRTVEVGPGPKGILTLAQNFNKGWKATLDGKLLHPVRVDGWEQAWLLPASASPVLVHLSFPPGRLYDLALLVGLVLAAAVVAFALFPRRWSRKPSSALNDSPMPQMASDASVQLDDRGVQESPSSSKGIWARIRPWVLLVALGVLAGLIGGPLAALVLPVTGLSFLAAKRRNGNLWPNAPAIATGLCMLAAGIVVALAPGLKWTAGLGPLSYTAQILGMIALLCVLATLIPSQPGLSKVEEPPRRSPPSTT